MAPQKHVCTPYETTTFMETVFGQKVICPHCNIPTPVQPWFCGVTATDRAHSSEKATIRVEVTIPAYIRTGSWSEEGYVVAVCVSCNEPFVVWKKHREPPRAVWPLAGIQVDDSVPERVRAAVKDAKRAFAAESVTGAIMSLRTAVARIQKQQKVADLTELWEKRSLPPGFFDTANENRHWGHMIAHDDFEPKDVTPNDVEALLEMFDVLLDIVYVTEARLSKIKSRRIEIQDPNNEPS